MRAGAVVRRVAGVATAVPVALAGWHALAGVIALAVIVVAAVCWTIANADRSRHLAMLFKAWRGNGRQAAGRAPRSTR